MRKPILILGEAYGETEAQRNAPFAGPSGKWLSIFLQVAGLPGARKLSDSRGEYYDWGDNPLLHLTNVFNLRPPGGNDVKLLCGPKDTGIPGMPSITAGKYIRNEYASELDRLAREIREINPNLIIALGNTSLWALTGKIPSISRNRGYLTTSSRILHEDGTPYKILPTYHPAYVLRDWASRPIVIKDLSKASRHYTTPEFSRPHRKIWIAPVIPDLYRFERDYLFDPSNELSIDIETKTKGHQHIITEIGLAPRKDLGIVVPFFSEEAPDGNYWATHAEERTAMEWCRRILNWTERPVFQNGMYDIAWLWRVWGMKVTHADHDTMLLWHSMQPEMRKSLGFLGSLHTDEPTWKFMRREKHAQKKEDI